MKPSLKVISPDYACSRIHRNISLVTHNLSLDDKLTPFSVVQHLDSQKCSTHVLIYSVMIPQSAPLMVQSILACIHSYLLHMYIATCDSAHHWHTHPTPHAHLDAHMFQHMYVHAQYDITYPTAVTNGRCLPNHPFSYLFSQTHIHIRWLHM